MNNTDPAPDYVALQRLYDSITDKTSECARRLARVLEGQERPPEAQERTGRTITHARPVRRSQDHSADDEHNYTE